MIFAVLVGVLLVLAYLLNEYMFNYWKKLGFKQLEPSFLIGNSGSLLRLKISMGEFFQDLYNKHKDCKALGIYFFYRPLLVINDAKLVQDIMIRDFTSFHDRPMPVDEENDPLSGKFIFFLKYSIISLKFDSTFVQHSRSKMERFESKIVTDVHIRQAQGDVSDHQKLWSNS
jgi:cytochrome P450 family 6